MFEDGRNIVALISDTPSQPMFPPGIGIHPEYNDIWIVLQGEYEWLIGDYPAISASKGDIVFCTAGTSHSIRAVSEPATRLAIYKGPRITEKGNHRTGRDKLPTQNKPPNLLITKHADILNLSKLQRKHTIISDERNNVFLISEQPGTVSKAHWHFDFDEWWYIPMGKLDFEVGKNRPSLNALADDIVFLPRGFRHQITTIGDKPSLRMPVTNLEGGHIWTDDDANSQPPLE